MLKNSKVIDVSIVKDSELIIPNRFFSLQDARERLDYYIQNGYTLKSVNVDGFASIPAGKSVYVFTQTRSQGDLGEISPPNLTYALSAAQLAGKTVVILGIIVDSLASRKPVQVYNLKIKGGSGYSYNIFIDIGTDTAMSGLTFELLGNIFLKYTGSSAVTGLTVRNCGTFGGYSASYPYTGTLPALTNIEINYVASCLLTGGKTYNWTTQKEIQNVKFGLGASGCTFSTSSSIKMTFNNCFFDNGVSGGNLNTFTGGHLFDFVNCYFRGYFSIASVASNSTAIYAFRGTNMINNTSYSLRVLSDAESNLYSSYFPIIFVKPNHTHKLETTLIPPNHTSFSKLFAKISTESIIKNSVYGSTTRQYYAVEFQPKTMVPDSLKDFNGANDWLIKRVDIEASFLSPQIYIKGLQLYLGYPSYSNYYSYRNDENFLIYAVDPDNPYEFSEQHIFIWYNGELRKTVFSSPNNDTVYIIKSCFQIWTIQDFGTLRNLCAIDDSPMEGLIKFNNFDNEVVV